MITTTLGLMDEATLLRRDLKIDNDNEVTDIVEYCLPDCDGQAHKSGVPDADSHFCNQHIHRGGSINLKQGIAALCGLGNIG